MKSFFQRSEKFVNIVIIGSDRTLPLIAQNQHFHYHRFVHIKLVAKKSSLFYMRPTFAQYSYNYLVEYMLVDESVHCSMCDVQQTMLFHTFYIFVITTR